MNTAVPLKNQVALATFPFPVLSFGKPKKIEATAPPKFTNIFEEKGSEAENKGILEIGYL